MNVVAVVEKEGACGERYLPGQAVSNMQAVESGVPVILIK